MSTEDRTHRTSAAHVPHARWQKAKASSNNGGSCVEVAFLPDRTVAVRDSKDPNGPALIFTANEWVALYLGMTGDDSHVTPPDEWITDFHAEHATV